MSYIYDPFFTRKTTISEKNSLIRPFFTLFVLSRRASDITTPLNIGGTNAWAVPHLKFFFCGGVPQSALGLRPCLAPPKRGRSSFLTAITSKQWDISPSGR